MLENVIFCIFLSTLIFDFTSHISLRCVMCSLTASLRLTWFYIPCSKKQLRLQTVSLPTQDLLSGLSVYLR